MLKNQFVLKENFFWKRLNIFLKYPKIKLLIMPSTFKEQFCAAEVVQKFWIIFWNNRIFWKHIVRHVLQCLFYRNLLKKNGYKDVGKV